MCLRAYIILIELHVINLRGISLLFDKEDSLCFLHQTLELIRVTGGTLAQIVMRDGAAASALNAQTRD